MANWKAVLVEIEELRREAQSQANKAVDLVRRKNLEKLFRHTNRNVIAYYSGFLSKPGLPQLDINDEDKNGFMMAVHNLERKKGLDLILHTPGGDIAATESLVDYLRQIFGKNIRAIVPQIAMSAGTMVACSCRSILMAKHSNLGPIDPHLGGMPAYGVIAEFDRALKAIKKDPSCFPVWQPILSKYQPTLLGKCANAIKWSNEFVREQLETVMFDGDPEKKKKAALVVRKLSSPKTSALQAVRSARAPAGARNSKWPLYLPPRRGSVVFSMAWRPHFSIETR